MWRDTPSLCHYLHFTDILCCRPVGNTAAGLCCQICSVFPDVYKSTKVPSLNQDFLKPTRHSNSQFKWKDFRRSERRSGWPSRSRCSLGPSHLSQDSSRPAASPCPLPALRSSVWWASLRRSYCTALGSSACDAWRWTGRVCCRAKNRLKLLPQHS